ncbi:MAG: uroporphyrinogen decarboxylase family protein [Spirochaetaceae bacterium]|jgi:uroporphyrinogen decarboxylase|nr:uroporphyrinogen decarboxylase family protein [Spirochaetaceae bacterium]
MNSRELIGDLLALKPTPRLPVTLMSAGAWALNSSGLSLEKALASPPEEVAEILYRAYTGVDSDIVWAVSGYNNIVIGAIGGRIKFRSKGTPDVIETLIKNPADAEGIDITRIGDDPGIRSLLNITRLLAKKVNGENYLALTRWGPFTLAGLLYGAENLMRDIYKNPEAVRRLLDFTVKLYLKYAELYFENGVDFVLLAEPTTSGDMISRKHFAAFIVPMFRTVFTELRKKNIRTALHICGNIENRLDLLADIGAELISVDYKVSLAKCRETFDHRVVFAGNLNPVNIMQRESPEGVERAAEACIAGAGEGPGYLLMPGCDIPPATPAENIRAMTRTGRAHVFKEVPAELQGVAG